MMNWDHLQDLSKDELIARVIHGEEQQANWERAYNALKAHAEAMHAAITSQWHSKAVYQIASAYRAAFPKE